MLFRQQANQKKLKLKGEQEQTIIMLNTQANTLEIISKHNSKQEEFWGSFSHADLDKPIQDLLDSIDTLYNYICENTEEVEVVGQKIIIKLNFLSTSKDIVLTLHPMLMFSQDEHIKLTKKIEALQTQLLRENTQAEGHRKLTLKMNTDTTHLNYYQITNFSSIRPFSRQRVLSLLTKHDNNLLPSNGIWHFKIQVNQGTANSFPSQSHRQSLANPPYLQLGLCNDKGESVSLMIKNYSFEQESKQDHNLLMIREQQLLQVVVNLDLRKLAVCRTFTEGNKTISWKGFRHTSRLWLTLKFSQLCILTDLFLPQPCINWKKETGLLSESETSFE